jgi:hypothetical protein
MTSKIKEASMTVVDTLQTSGLSPQDSLNALAIALTGMVFALAKTNSADPDVMIGGITRMLCEGTSLLDTQFVHAESEPA